MELLVILVAGFLFMFFNELEDECISNNWKGKYEKWNTKNSWKGKWKLDKDGNPLPYEKKWYHFGVPMPKAERYPYGSTLFVGFSDAEHFFQMMKVLSVCLGFAVYGFWPAASFFVGHILLGVAKETVFKSFLR